jgi:hypothetical protein
MSLFGFTNENLSNVNNNISTELLISKQTKTVQLTSYGVESQRLLISDGLRFTNGILPSGDFVLTATTDEKEWTLNPYYEGGSMSLIGNRVGQMCFLYIHLVNNTEKRWDCKEALFVKVPETFRPQTQVSFAVQETTNEMGTPPKCVNHACVVFDEKTKSVYIATATGWWEPGEIIFGSISYFKA